MNIFVLDRDPYIAASMMCDAHVVKMVLESCQLLSTHDRLHGDCSEDLYRPTHAFHPCRRCLEEPSNRLWLMHHLAGLLMECRRRYGRVHACEEMARRHWIAPRPWDGPVQDFNDRLSMMRCIADSSLPKCMPDECRTGGAGIEAVVESYRRYYRCKKASMKRFGYTRREEPPWLKEES